MLWKRIKTAKSQNNSCRNISSAFVNGNSRVSHLTRNESFVQNSRKKYIFTSLVHHGTTSRHKNISLCFDTSTLLSHLLVKVVSTTLSDNRDAPQGPVSFRNVSVSVGHTVLLFFYTGSCKVMIREICCCQTLILHLFRKLMLDCENC